MTQPKSTAPRTRPRHIAIAIGSAVAALLIALAFVGIGHVDPAGEARDRGTGRDGRPPSFAASTGRPDSEPSHADPNRPPSFEDATPAPKLAPERVAQVMVDWRNAILVKNAETVEAIDDAFHDHPDDFLPALMQAAKSEADPRVRAFCTRVLGKLRRPESLARLRELLSDESEFVRHNAAWALAQLDDVPSMNRIEHLAAMDPSSLVRQSASESLARLRAAADGRRLP